MLSQRHLSDLRQVKFRRPLDVRVLPLSLERLKTHNRTHIHRLDRLSPMAQKRTLVPAKVSVHRLLNPLNNRLVHHHHVRLKRLGLAFLISMLARLAAL